MHPELKLLISLQAIDHQIELFKREIEIHKKSITELQKEKKETEETIEKVKKEEKDALFKLKKEEELLKEIEYKIEQKKNELFSGKFTTSKELLGFQKELRRLEEEKDQKETEILILMEEYENLKENVKESEKKSEIKVKRIEEKLKNVEKELKNTEKELKNLLKKREGIKTQIDKKYLNLYEEIRKEKSEAVVKIKGNTCTGCHLDLPGIVIDRVSTGEEIVICPNCGRILYLGEE